MYVVPAAGDVLCDHLPLHHDDRVGDTRGHPGGGQGGRHLLPETGLHQAGQSAGGYT